MKPYEAYMDFMAVRAHFNRWEYDYFLYRQRIRHMSQDKFDQHRDRFHYVRVARHYDPHWVIVSNLAEDPRLWIRDVTEAAYVRRVGVLDSFGYRLIQELPLLDSDFNSNFVLRNKKQPNLIRLYLAKKISLEVATVLASLTGATDAWRRTYDPFVRDVAERFAKYAPFVFTRIDREAAREKIITFLEKTIDAEV